MEASWKGDGPSLSLLDGPREAGKKSPTVAVAT